MASERPHAAGWTLRPAVLVFLLALTLLKGLRMPNRWAVTHELFTYQFGFMKRALWGELLHLVFGGLTANYFCLAIVGLVVFVLFVGLLLHLASKLDPAIERTPLLLMLFASPALAFYAHLAGYLEEVAYLGAAVVLALAPRPRAQLAAAIACAAALPLVHEASLLWIGALVVLAVLVGGPASRPARDRLRAAAIVAAIFLASTAAVLRFGQVTAERAALVRDATTQYFEVRPRQDAFQTLTIPLGDSLRELRGWWVRADVQADLFFSLLVFAPGAILLTIAAVRRARDVAATGTVRGAAVVLVAAAVAGPLLLHLVGRDGHRWNALAALNAGLAALTLAGAPSTGARPPRRSLVGPGLALAVCLWGVSADPVFFDLYTPAHPPFAPQLRFLYDDFRGGQREWWIPAQGR